MKCSNSSMVMISVVFIFAITPVVYAQDRQDEYLIITESDGVWAEQESGVNTHLFSVYFVDREHGWVTGEEGVILSTADGGQTWVAQESGISTNLNLVFFINNAIGWAAGNEGVILFTDDGGENWTPQQSGVSVTLGRDYSDRGIYFSDDQTGWIAGDEGVILHTTDGGLNWQTQESGLDSWLYTLHFTDNLSGWASGTEGIILRTEDGGDNWEIHRNLEDIEHEIPVVYSINFSDPDNGCFTHWDGALPSEQTLISCTKDGGESWTINTDTSPPVYSLQLLETGKGWAAGGAIYHTSGDSDNWHKQKDVWVHNAPLSFLYSVYFTDEESGWAVGTNGQILHFNARDVSADDNAPESIPDQFALFQNYPNPFNPVTVIVYELPEPYAVTLQIFDITGRLVETLVYQVMPAGRHEVTWEASDAASGVYMYRLSAGDVVQSRSMMLLR